VNSEELGVFYDEPDRRRVPPPGVARRKVRAPQDMMPGNSREKSAGTFGIRVFRQTAQQKVNRPAIAG